MRNRIVEWLKQHFAARCANCAKVVGWGERACKKYHSLYIGDYFVCEECY